jgi:hypothetical protein
MRFKMGQWKFSDSNLRLSVEAFKLQLQGLT